MLWRARREAAWERSLHRLDENMGRVWMCRPEYRGAVMARHVANVMESFAPSMVGAMQQVGAAMREATAVLSAFGEGMRREAVRRQLEAASESARLSADPFWSAMDDVASQVRAIGRVR